MPLKDTPLFAHQRESLLIPITIYQPGSTTPLDLTNASAVAAAIVSDFASPPSESFAATFINPRTSGRIDLFLTTAKTALLDPGLYRYDMRVNFSDGTATVFLKGPFTILASATPATP